MRCLVVDDSKAVRRIMVNALRSIGYQDTVEACDARQALEFCDGSVGLVVSNCNMPSMSGVELVRRLRESPVTCRVAILLVTTRSASSDIEGAMQAGANGYITKPFTPQTLNEKIEEISARVSV